VTAQVPIETGGAVTIDKKRIYMAGHSNGCIMGFGVAALESDMVAAVCCHAGYAGTPFASDYSPVPSFSIFGVKDSTILYEGASLGPQRYMGQVAQLTRLGDANGCNSDVVTTPVVDPTSGVEVGEILSRSECTDGADVSLLALYESGHTPFYNEDQSFLDEGETPTTLDTTQLAWEFCSQFEKAVEPDLTSSTAAPTKAPVSAVEDTKDATSNPTASPTSSGDGLLSRNASITGMTLIVMGLFGWALI
jgi:poly(3-hydroxybutyrate) depolymerase